MMNILLIGEYSNFHNSLKQGLSKYGHQVIITGGKDGFKSLPVDISLNPDIFQKFPLKPLKLLFYRIFNFDISVLEVVIRFFLHRKKFKNFDSVQLINEFPFKTTPFFDRFMLSYIFKHNKNVSLSACGDDHVYISYILNSKLPYHVLTPYLIDKSLKENYQYSLRYLKSSHVKLSKYVHSKVQRIIPANMDYFMAYKGKPKVVPMIPFPVNVDKFKYEEPALEQVIIFFHGINTINYIKKGNALFEKALKKIKANYKDQIEINQIKSVPYQEYISLYNHSHILLDQTYAYSQGYNALEAMATGKVVFTGLSEIFKTHYKLEKEIGIEAVPDVEILYRKMQELIEEPKKIKEISKNARWFVETYHHYERVAENYLKTWELS
jgi:glycosyltransferase involved in cell wall biosynthesis